jgi:hypothetical protein
MIIFNSTNLLFQKSGLVIFCLQFFLFIICLPLFHVGTWFQTEPAMLVVFIFGALNTLWLAIGIFKKFLVIERPTHPLLYGLMAWGIWQFITVFFAENTISSWLGSPQTGEGNSWQIMLLVSVAVTMPLWQVNAYKKIILSSAIISLCTMLYLHLNLKTMFIRDPVDYLVDNPIAPANWPDYLPFIAGWVWLAYASTPSLRTTSRHGLMIMIICTSLLIGGNHAARLIMFPAIIFLSFVLWLQLLKQKPSFIKKFIVVTKTWKTLAILGILLPLGWIAISQEHDLFKLKKTSLAERAIFNQVAIAAIADNPLRLVTGNGWTSFSGDLFKYGLVDGLTSFENGIFSPNTYLLYGGAFHPHNQPMEALLATGIVGLLIFISLPILSLLYLRRSLFWWCVPIVIAISFTSNFWFLLPQVMNFQALGLAALCSGRPAQIRQTRTIPPYIAVICAALVSIFTVSTYEQLNIIRYGERLKVIMNETPNKEGIKDWISQDITRGGKRMAEAITYFSKEIAAKVYHETVGEKDRDWYRNFLEIVHLAAQQPNSGFELKKLELDLYRQLFELPKASILDNLKPQAKSRLIPAIINFSKAYPAREDYIAPFLMNLDGLTDNDSEKQRTMLNDILKVAPKHRSALWLVGTLYEALPPTQEKGIEMKKQAVKLGVERVYPATKQELIPYR